MMAVILAGGLGTRLKPFTVSIPKPLLPLGETSILEIVVKQLVSCGFDRIVMTLGYMAPIFPSILGDGSKYGIRIDYIKEETPLGTAGSLRLIKDHEENFLVMNADILTTLNYRDLLDVHVRQGAYGTISVTKREAKIDYGVVEIDEEGLLASFREKPVLSYEVSMGINVLSKECVAYIPHDRKFDMPDLMLTMKNDGKKVYCYRTDCYWQDIGRFDDYQKASEDFVTEPARYLGRGK